MAQEEQTPPAVVQEEQAPQETPVLNEVVEKEASGSIIGQVKWFNDRLGYGFVTVNQGDDKGRDIFVHHSGIKPANSNYKTLRKGEYVNFNVVKGLNGSQAVDVTGINGGPLMCDIVMGSRKPGEMLPPYPGGFPPPPPPMARAPQDPSAWQTVPGKRPYVQRVQAGPGGPGGPGGPPSRPFKNTNKYNKATRNLPMGAVPPPPPSRA